MDNKKALVLFSGGVDSTTCLAMAIKKHGAENVIPLSVYYGQRHETELKMAHKISDHYKLDLISIDLREMFKNASCSLLAGSNEDIPKESYEEQLKHTNGKPVSTYVPFRNGLFLAAAASIALSNGCSVIYYGAHRDDAAGNAYPDCSEEFNNSMSRAIYLGSGNELTVEAPFVTKTKADIVKLGLELSVPYELTWSCYEGGERPCGKCGTCIDRRRAFELNGITDPLETTYSEE